MLLGIAAFVAALLVIVLVHELGHLLAARWAGMEASVFSVGFGPRLAGFRWGETEVRLSALPLGGYVKVDAMEREVPTPDGPRLEFDTHPLHRRVVVLGAGVAMNVLLALAIYTALPMVWGEVTPRPAQIGAVAVEALPDGMGAWAGLSPGSEVVRVGRRSTGTWADLALALVARPPGPVEVELAGGRILTLPVPAGDEAKLGLVEALAPTRPGEAGAPGDAAGEERRRVGPVPAVLAAGARIGHDVRIVGRSLEILLTGALSPRQLGGPVAAGALSLQALDAGPESFLVFVAFLSVNIGLMNLLPIPVLDGGYLALCLVEAVRGRPAPLGLQDYLARAGTVFLILVMVAVTTQDLLRLLGA